MRTRHCGPVWDTSTTKIWYKKQYYSDTLSKYISYADFCIQEQVWEGADDADKEAVVGRINLKRVRQWVSSTQVKWQKVEQLELA